MFLPRDLTTSESELVATIERQLFSRRSPQTPEQERAVRQEATEVAAEMIWEARGQLRTEEAEAEEQEAEEAMAESPYHQFLARVREAEREIQEIEDREREAEEAAAATEGL